MLPLVNVFVNEVGCDPCAQSPRGLPTVAPDSRLVLVILAANSACKLMATLHCCVSRRSPGSAHRRYAGAAPASPPVAGRRDDSAQRLHIKFGISRRRVARALAGRPEGPLASTHPTGKRKNSSGTGRRFDSIWLTGHWTVQHISHLYDDGIAAGSDHALVITDLATA